VALRSTVPNRSLTADYARSSGLLLTNAHGSADCSSRDWSEDLSRDWDLKLLAAAAMRRKNQTNEINPLFQPRAGIHSVQKVRKGVIPGALCGD
jgi:hypothetical protein